MTTRLLAIGDLHVGRRPAALAAAAAEAGLDLGALSPTAAWGRAVDAALAERVDAVLLAGDLVDEERDRFEALAHIERGARRLAEAGIPVLAVAGNHDGEVLPRLVARLPAVRLLGAGGRWERVEVGDVDVVAWSFPARAHPSSPLDAPGLEAALAARRPGAAAVLLLHADLVRGARRSRYAPLDERALEALAERERLDAALLGHVHRPADLAARPFGHLGSLVGLDAGEVGPRGPWLVEAEGAGRLRARRLDRVVPLRWEVLELDAASLPAEADALFDAARAAARRRLEVDPSLAGCRAVAARLRLVGEGDPAALARAASALDARAIPVDGLPWLVHEVVVDVRPPVDLPALAARPGPLAPLAALLLDLEGGSPPGPEARELARRLLDAFPADAWGPLEPLREADALRALRDAARSLLAELSAEVPR